MAGLGSTTNDGGTRTAAQSLQTSSGGSSSEVAPSGAMRDTTKTGTAFSSMGGGGAWVSLAGQEVNG
jgi:hypothetical protein